MDFVHIYIKKEGNRTVTLIENLDYNKKTVKQMKVFFHCNGTVKDNIILLSGDQRENVYEYLSSRIDVNKIKIHGY